MRAKRARTTGDSSVIDGMDVPTLLHGGSTFIYDYIKWHVDAPDDFIVEIVNDDELEDEENTKDPSPKIPKKSGRGSRGPEPKFVSSSPEYFCSICNRAFTTQFLLTRDITRFSMELLQRTRLISNVLNATKIFFCNDELNRHMIKAHNCPNTVIYRCDQCGRLFPSKYELARHKVKIHEPRTIPCTFCNEKFSRHFLMRDHMKRTHTRSLEVKCKTCNEMVPLSDMEAHMIREHSTTWKCLVCGKIFLKQSLMIQHELEQHSG
ncbi:KRAB [Lepeophtheirus salmonis]|uniref:KRAB n=1 Tax=Lepeophtheirus salmonis TaxID=72036 RepID=A0A7R8CL55_LEPSM|nr:KRAB [Lepeophtheirus salmonis]CAF2854233.1 KRAB [Lepeophtheirus salmonis]